MSDIRELKQLGISVQAISRLTGYDRKTIRKYLISTASPHAPNITLAFRRGGFAPQRKRRCTFA